MNNPKPQEWKSEELSQGRIIDYKAFNFVDGEGVRNSLYVSGCMFHCEGCYNVATWSFNAGIPYTAELEEQIMADLAQPYVQGLTLLGGEPFLNTGILLPLVKRIRKELPDKDIWSWTGYTWEEMMLETPDKLELLSLIDILVDGRYDRTKRNLMLQFRGSSTSNGQTPFTSLGFGLGTSRFEREIQKAILNIRIKGLGSEHRTAIFPKLIFTLKRGLNLEEGTPNYDIKQLALECATKRMYPDVLSYDKIVDLTGSFKVPMGCRSFLQGWKDENGVEVNSGRMNLGVVTVNLPRIALESEGDMNKFWEIFNERMNIAEDALVYRVERTKEATPANAPILYQYGAFGHRLGKEESVDQLFKNRRATVSLGYIGLYEVATVFFGNSWESNPDAKEFTLDIIHDMKRRVEEWSDQYGYHFSIYSTPSESLTDRFCRLDIDKFGSIPDITDKEYYTNSFHYDVRKNPTPFEKLDFEKVYPEAGASGGFIHYCEYPVLQQNPKALEAVWDYAYDRVGYLGTNTPIDRCYKCDFEGDFEPTERGFACPNCGNSDPKTVDVVKRTCGYLGNPQARPMVNGRHKEIAARVKHMNGSTIKIAGHQVTN
ncbi:anaerobic ribonucleotide reductase [Streptococcus pneumoniae]|nr:anaerobic ribonucleotide reductase [Streptococcus pneumoniae]